MQLYLIEDGSQIEFFNGHQKKVGKYKSMSSTSKENHLIFMHYSFVSADEGFAGVTTYERYGGILIREKETGILIWANDDSSFYHVEEPLILYGEEINKIEIIASRFLYVKKADLFTRYDCGNCGIPETVSLKYDDGREYSLDQNYEILPLIRYVNQVFNNLHSSSLVDKAIKVTVITCGYGRQNTEKIQDPFESWTLCDFSESFGSMSEPKALSWDERNYFSFRFEERPELSFCSIQNEFYSSTIREYKKILEIKSEYPVFTINTKKFVEVLAKIENSFGDEDCEEKFYISIKKENNLSVTRYVAYDTIENIVKLISENSNGAGKSMILHEVEMDYREFA